MKSPTLPLSVLAAGVVAFIVLSLAPWRRHSSPPGPPAGSPTPGISSAQSPALPPLTVAPPSTAARPAENPEPLHPLQAARPDRQWRSPVSEPAFADFRQWTDDYAAAPAAERPALLENGLKLARERRAELSDLMERDPRRAWALQVPPSVRRGLPEGITAELEQPLDGRGDLLVAAFIAMPGQEARVRPAERQLEINGRTLKAFTFGQRESEMSRRDIPVAGMVLDDKIVINEYPARILEPDAAATARATAANPPTCPVSGLVTEASEDEVVLDYVWGEPNFFCGPKHAQDQLDARLQAELALPPGVAASGIGGAAVELPVAMSGYTEGTKKMLIIRVDFPDKAGQVVSDATLNTLIDNFGTHWAEMSYGKTTWSKAGAGSDFTPTLRLPNPHASYTGFGTMLNAARAAASAAGYDYADYNFDVVVTGDKPDVGFGGVAFVGGRGAWLANGQWNLGVGSHEVGHNFGLNHAGYWQTTDKTTIGAGSNVEYGNPYDHMGGASSATRAHFGARQKNYLDWLPDGDVLNASASNTYRINAFDMQAATGKRTIKIDRAGTTTNDYWIEYRQTWASSNKWAKDGVFLNWGPHGINNAKPMLLDIVPGGTKDDCPLLIGRTFSDGDIHITPVLRGADTATTVTWVDVVVNRGTFATDQKPTVTVGASNINPAVNGTITCTATTSDPDGDTVAYFWDWGDGTWTANNSASATHSWSASGTKTVRCLVTDMKGKTATGPLLVQVGTSSTSFIQGVVKSSAGLPLEGAVVSADATHTDTTDSEGYFAITGLATGSYTVTAAKGTLTMAPDGFTNPVAVGPNKQNVNFKALPGAPGFTAIKPGLVDAGSNTGAVILGLSDPDTATSALTVTGVSSDTTIIPAANIAFGTSGTLKTCTVTAPAGKSGTVNITISAGDGATTAAYVWPVTVNAPPVLTAGTPTTPENTPLTLDLRTLVTDDLTTDDFIRFSASRVRNGSVSIAPDGYTATFTPAPNFQGAASFLLRANDQSLSSRTLLFYDFESATDVTTGALADLSNFSRTGSIDSVNNGTYGSSIDVPQQIAPQSGRSLALTEVGTNGAARVIRAFTTEEFNFSAADWTASVWVKRKDTTNDDVVFHLGAGDGAGPEDELDVFFPAGADELRLEKWNGTTKQAAITAAGLPAGAWHHVTVTCDNTASGVGTLALYVDGFLVNSVAAVPLAFLQGSPVVFGGTAVDTANTTRWLEGQLDEVTLFSGVVARAEIMALAGMPGRNELGLSATVSVPVTVTGVNQPPAIGVVGDAGLAPGQVSAPIPFILSDAESEARTLTVSASSSNTTLLPNTGLTLSTAPAAWTSQDIGAVTGAGSTTEDHGTFLVSASGAGITGTADEFRFVHQPLAADGEILCRVTSLDFSSEASKTGVMLRDGVTADAPFAFAGITAGQGLVFLSRATAATAVTSLATVNGVSAPCWVRLTRTGGSITASWAPDSAGTPGAWTALGTPLTLTLAYARAGLAHTSAVDGTQNMAVIDHVGGSVQLGGERTITLAPAAGQSGIANVTLTASDGAATATRSFRVVVGLNEPPTLEPIADFSVVDGSTPVPVALTVGDLHTAAASLTLTAFSSNPNLVPDSRVVFSGTGAARSMLVRPVPGETGTATIMVTLSDGTLTTTRTFTVTVTPGDPTLLVHAGGWWRYLDTGANPSSWTTPLFNDSSWPRGPAQLGFGDPQETYVAAVSSRITTYFRRHFTVTDLAAAGWLKLRLLRDDGVVIYLNGQEIWRDNMPAGPVTPATLAPTAVSNAAETTWYTRLITTPPVVLGENTLAVELHQNSTASSDLSFDLEVQAVQPAPTQVIAPGSVWTYLDTGVDPGAAWNTTAFTATGWKSGPAQLGYGDGDEATTIASGPDNAHYPANWFRQTFTVDDASRIAQLGLRLKRDDGAVVYLNGIEILRDNMPTGVITATTLAEVSIGGTDEQKWNTFTLSPAALVTGTNLLAVEVHQKAANSSDISFDAELLTYRHEALPQISCDCRTSGVTMAWPAWAEGWLLQSSPDMAVWTTLALTPVETQGRFSVTLPRTTTKLFYRLIAP